MATVRDFDAIIIGSGQAGPFLAGRLNDAGQRVCLVERKHFGGTCVNTGCMPTKTLVASAQAAHVARRAGDFGVLIDGPIRVDMKKVRARAAKVISEGSQGIETWLRGMKNVTVLMGTARFVGPRELEVDGQRITAPRVFLNVGGRAIVPSELAGVPHLTNSSMVELDVLPKHLLVLGGSYIALEFAQMYRRFGSKVTVFERGSRLVGREDEDVSQAVREILEKEGLDIRLNARPLFARSGDGVSATLDGETIAGSHLLVAIGRQPNTADLGLDRAGIAMDAHGYINVDDELRTSADGVWALGDCNGRGAFTHTSYNDFEIVADNLLANGRRRLSDRIPCHSMFIDPPLARCGLSPADAKKAGKKIRVGRRPMTRVGRANEKDEREGFMQIVVEEGSDEILGATILGVGGDEAIHAVLDMMANGATAKKLRETMHIHPTVAELFPTLAGELKEA